MTRLHPQSKRVSHSGFSIIELLIVITILGILVAAMIPAIHSSREAARSLQCRNNLRQLGIAATNHLNASGYFPSGGWGFHWAGDPDRGFGSSQPGGWIFSLLPYIEEKALWSSGAGIDLAKNPTAKQSAAAGQVSKPIPGLYCPSRRDAALYPYSHMRQPLNMTLSVSSPLVLKTDYAANAGDAGKNQQPGPASIEEAFSGKFKWPKNKKLTGISFQRSQVTTAQVEDGLSHTYLAGEKYLNPQSYLNGRDIGDNDAATEGFDNDMDRLAGPGNRPMCDTMGVANELIFGSAHAVGFNMVFCDGSVHMIDYGIDPLVHNHLANRADGQSISSTSIH